MSASPQAALAFPRRFLSLWMPYLPTDRIRRQRDHTHGLRPLNLERFREKCAAVFPQEARPIKESPLVLVTKATGTQRITAANRAAELSGLEAGMALAQARAMLPDLYVLPHDAAADVRLLENIADWADRYTPLVGRDPPHGLLLDITGAAHLLGGETALAADLVNRLARQGLHAIVAIAPTPGAAWALAHYGETPAHHSASTLLPETISRTDLDTALAPLPVSGLRLAPETVAALRRVGLKRIGDLIGRPRSALAARFGAQVILRLDQARGIDTEAISPRQPIPPAIVEQTFAEPILATAAVEQTCSVLSKQLCAVLEDRGQGATALALAVYRVDGLVKRIDLKLASPCRDAKTMAGLLTLRLGHLDDPLDPGFGYDLIRLAATAIATKDAETRRLAGLGTEMSAGELAHTRAALVNRLTARFGGARIHTLAFAATHIPEYAAKLVREGTAEAKPKPSAPLAQPQSASLDRPIRLFDPPEPVEVMAEVPDGPPIHLRWRRRPLRIVAAHGPERIAPEWWRPQALAAEHAADNTRNETRDYWRIEDATGRRLWLYREGFYGARDTTPESRPPRWYVHGLFA